jgi:hypothetical protein
MENRIYFVLVNSVSSEGLAKKFYRLGKKVQKNMNAHGGFAPAA